MARVLTNVNGVITIVTPNVASAGASSAGNLVQLDANGRLDSTVLPAGVGADAISVVTTEALAAGAIVNIVTAGARNASNASSATEAVGYVTAAFASGATATVFKEGTVTGLSGLTVGSTYYLGTGGALVLAAAAPSAVGTIIQIIGKAVTATSVDFSPQQIYVNAL
jgi:hypothetical protein